MARELGLDPVAHAFHELRRPLTPECGVRDMAIRALYTAGIPRTEVVLVGRARGSRRGPRCGGIILSRRAGATIDVGVRFQLPPLASAFRA
jgi:hypothetical protein